MLQLLINGNPADIRDDTLISVTKQYESVSNPTLYYADWSKTVKLPISPQNNAIFSNFNRLDSAITNVSINPVQKIPCAILNNQEPVMEGYCRLDNANTVYTDECYSITIFSTFGLIINELKMLTFNKNSDVTPRYIINSPLSDDLKIDRNLVKQSFEQQQHYLNSENVLDWIGFLPSYQGKYDSFSSDKVQILQNGRTDDMSRERDEHYTREMRSYYQQPFVYVDKLWQAAKEKIEEITDYRFILDKSFFNASNPYYKDLIYTCPSLFSTDNNFRQSFELYEDSLNVIKFNKPSHNPPLNLHQLFQLRNLHSDNAAEIFDEITGIFNKDADFGSTKLKGRFKLTLFASIPGDASDDNWYCKITNDNPFFVKVKAVNSDTGEDIYGAHKTFLIYSSSHDINEDNFDEGIDIGICSIANTGVNLGLDGQVGYRPLINHTGYQTGTNHAWEADLNIELNVQENVPYKVYFEIWNSNNGDPFEYTNVFSGITWDWLWRDDFNETYGQNNDKGYSMYFDTISVSCETTENLRTGSDVSLYRVFPKDVTLCDVLLNYSKIFGLAWEVNEHEKTITIMSRNRFFSDYKILDWSSKIDRSKEFVFAPLNFDKRYAEFNFDEGECGRLKNYQSTYQINYGSKKLDTGYEFNADTNELMQNLTPSVIAQKRQYSILTNTEYEDEPNFMGYNYMIYPNEHYVDNDDNGSNAGMSGAFYFRNGTFKPDASLSFSDINGNRFIAITDDTQHMIQTQEFCWNRSGEGAVVCYDIPDISTISNDCDGKRYSIHFESPKEYYFKNPNGEIKYTYDAFWKNYINERYCSQNKKLTAYIYLTIDEFKDINFKEFIKIDNLLYHIDKIYDFNFNSNDPVKMDLVQVWALDAYTEGQDEAPYLYTIPETVNVTTTAQAVNVYTSYEEYHVAYAPSWITATIVDGNLSVKANSTTDFYRSGGIVLLKGAEGGQNEQLDNGWHLTVRQFRNVNYRLDVDRNTIVFEPDGGVELVQIDCHDLSNDAISVAKSAGWIGAKIVEYTQTEDSNDRDCLHLAVIASPTGSTLPRNGTVALSIIAGGTTYTQTINIGQQGGQHHTRNNNYRIITDEESGLEIYNEQNQAVTTLISGETYHFSDLFPEEIDVNSIRITGGGSVNITGNVGVQTIEFIPQLSEGKVVGGGLITATTLNGNIVSYAYNVEAQGVTPTPEKRHIVVSADANSMFKLEASPSVSSALTTNYFEGDFVDGTVLTLTAIPNDEYTLDYWIDNGGTKYTTPVVNITVSSSIVDQDNNFIIKLLTKKGQKTYKVLISAGDHGYITVSDDETHYTEYEKTVVEGTIISDVKVTSNAGFTFSQWDDGSAQNPRDFIVLRDTAIKAIYTGGLQDAKFIIDGGGLLGANDSIYLYLDGEETAMAGAGAIKKVSVPYGTYNWKLYCQINDTDSVFANWYVNDGKIADNPYDEPEMVVDKDYIIKVVCVKNVRYLVKISALANGNVSVNGVIGNYSQQVLKGTTLALLATPNAGYQFDSWSDGNTNSSRNITINSPLTLTASFEEIPIPTDGYFYVEDISGEENQITILKNSADAPIIEVFYSTDAINWSSMGYTSTAGITATVPANGKLYLKATANAWAANANYYNYIKCSGNHNVGGHIMSLLTGDNFEDATLTTDHAFSHLFCDNTKLINAEELIMPSNVTKYCYEYMFEGCRTLAVCPELPATILADYCYKYMFNTCSSLEIAPELPATILADHCYEGMFQLCALSEAPVLPATTLAPYCYEVMFHACNNLKSVIIYADDISAGGALYAWLRNVSPTGDFYNYGSATYDIGDSGIPIGWIEHKPTPTEEYFYVEDTSGEENQITIRKNSAIAPTIEVFKSTDMVNWESMGSTSTTGITATIPANGKLYLKATATKWAASDSYYNYINCSGNHNVGGHIMSLLAGDDYEDATLTENYAFSVLFYSNQKLISAEDLILPSNVTDYGYFDMFGGCTSLTTPPVLPATELAPFCYDSMFTNCTSLTTPPALPATILSRYCYDYMFSGCSSLTTAPTLPATTMFDACYFYMFQGCTALTQAPELPAMTLAEACYEGMFYGCTALTTAPELPAMTLAEACYEGMFYGCTALTTAPALTATTLISNCYSSMFQGCTALATAPELPATTLALSCYWRMFRGCTALTTAPTLPATSLEYSCYSGMFGGCSSLTQAPELPAMTLAEACYYSMFGGCTSLTTAPVLLAETLAIRCYWSMFKGCTSLNSVTTYATDISANSCIDDWLGDVSATGDFYNLGGATYPSGDSGIPTAWTEHTSN